VQSDVRAVLQYVPSFHGKTFVLVLNAARMTQLALAEALLDLIALQQVGVKLVVISTGSGEAQLSHLLTDGELKWQAAELDAEKVTAILERGQLALVESPDLPKLFHRAAEVCASGIPRVHLLDEAHQGVLMDELFSNEGVGVMVFADDYLSVRAIGPDDISELLAMVGRSMRDAHLVPRSYEEIETSLEDFQVLTIDGNVVGCVALHPSSDPHCGEVACLYVKQCPIEVIPKVRQERLQESGRESMVIRKQMIETFAGDHGEGANF